MKLSVRKQQIIVGLITPVVVGAISYFMGTLGYPRFFIVPAAVFGIALFLLIVKNPYWGAILIAFLLPYERLGALEVGTIGTLRGSQVVALFMIVAWLWWYMTTKKPHLARTGVLYPMLAFLVVNTISLYNALNLNRSGIVFFLTVFVVLMSFVVANVVTSTKIVRWIVGAIFVTSVLVCLFGLYQFLGDLLGIPNNLTGLRVEYTRAVFGFPRIQSTALEPLYFANFLLIPIGLAASYALAAGRKSKPFGYLILLVLFILSVALTLSRGGYLGLAGLVVALCFLYFKKVFRPITINIVIALVAVVAVGVLVFLRQSPDSRTAIQNYLDQATNLNKGVSIEERYGFYTQAWKAFQDHPFFGVGPGGFGPYVAENPLQEPISGWLIVNNITLEVLAETGIVGLIFFLLFFYGLLKRSIGAIRRTQDPWLKATHAGALAAMIGILVQYQTFSILFIVHVWFLIGLLVALQNLAPEKESPLPRASETPQLS